MQNYLDWFGEFVIEPPVWTDSDMKCFGEQARKKINEERPLADLLRYFKLMKEKLKS